MSTSLPALLVDDPPAQRLRLGMWVFLASEAMFFGPLLLAYCYGRLVLGEAFLAACRHTDVVLGTLNTALLLTSSLAMALAHHAAGMQCWRACRRLLAIVFMFGAIFITVKAFEYRYDWQQGLYPGGAAHAGGADFFYLLYYVLTGLHGLHLLIGMALVAFLLARLRSPAAKGRWVEGIGLYWHFVDLVWIFLYPMLYLAGRAS